MPADTSDYIKKTRLLAIANGKNAAAARKFRALTQHDVYDPYRITQKTIGSENFKSPVPHHNIFGARQISADKEAYFNRNSNTIVIPDGFCRGLSTINVTAGVTYNLTNNSTNIYFAIIPPIGFNIYFEIPLGQSQLTAGKTGRLECD